MKEFFLELPLEIDKNFEILLLHKILETDYY
jgi:hypothetical protein